MSSNLHKIPSEPNLDFLDLFDENFGNITEDHHIERGAYSSPGVHHLEDWSRRLQPSFDYSAQAISQLQAFSFVTPSPDSQSLTGAAPSPLPYHASNSTPRSMSMTEDDNSQAQSAPKTKAYLPPPKQIRFVRTDGPPHAKRRRINAACLTCRKRKTRCGGERPVCKTCADNGHECAGYAGKPEIGQKPADEPNATDGDDGGEGTINPTTTAVSASDVAPNPKARRPRELNRNESAVSNSVDFRSPESVHTVNSATALRHRVPFFRYFGPTAIVPGFKQMVVQVKDRDHRRSAHSVSGGSPASGHPSDIPSVGREPSPQEIVFYDATDPGPVQGLITHLCEAFFTHLGCNYPFLQRERFMRDLEEKRVDAILVDAVCAIGARFSTDLSLSRASDQTTPLDNDGRVKRAFKGQPYAQRAASALVDTFGCPTIAVAQACLLLAYEEFGTDRDSGLWMFLGTSIRMAQDLGIQKLEGMQLEGRMGPTPKTVKKAEVGKLEEHEREAQQAKLAEALREKDDAETMADRRASEAERIDTFWAIFFLDRAVSSGVGRPVTLRDKDIEISFPYRPDETMINGHPHPFPVMIRIVHLYGRIADVVNNIPGSSQVNSEGLKQLTVLEKDLTGIYQRMPPKLHFNATNFQHYVKAGQGTNFILLHFWFHTSIILLHQPTLLYSLETKVQQLFPDSRELSISSAKTIADILAFAELIDVKSFIGNPFTSQPMYVAACAFLAEARAHASQPASRQASPPEKTNRDVDVKPDVTKISPSKPVMDSKMAAKHSLLATAANQNYQRCYKALKMLDSYWAGCRYILTALDQKSKGLMDPILYTQEDIDGEMPSIEPQFTQPGWRRSSHGPSPAYRRASIEWSPKMDWSQAIGWSLTGTTNSPAPNLSFLYPHPTADGEKHGHVQLQAKQQQPALARPQVPAFEANPPQPIIPAARPTGTLPYDPVSAADADLLLGLHSPYSVPSGSYPAPRPLPPTSTTVYDYGTGTPHSSMQQSSSNYFSPSDPSVQTPGFTDMLIESQDVDMSQQQYHSQLGFDGLNLPGGDMIWLEYLPQDVLSYFNQGGDPNQQQDDNVPLNPSNLVMPSGPRPTGPGTG